MHTGRRGAVLDPTRALADPAGRPAFASLAAHLRAVGYANEPVDDVAATHLALGHAVPADELRAELGSDVVDTLVGCGALGAVADDVEPGFGVLAVGHTLALLPRLSDARGHVYLGPDSIRLLGSVWPRIRHGHRAADLGTGNGFLAAALATRFDLVVAADLAPRCAATAAFLPILNPQLRGRVAASVHDVAAGLRPGAFDVVVANAPWVPEVEWVDGSGVAGPARTFAAGGPTGFELPRRFLREGADLLAPGGQLFVACLDLTFDDGRRPLRDELARLSTGGATTDVLLADGDDVADVTDQAREALPSLARALLVVAHVARPAAT